MTDIKEAARKVAEFRFYGAPCPTGGIMPSHSVEVRQYARQIGVADADWPVVRRMSTNIIGAWLSYR